MCFFTVFLLFLLASPVPSAIPSKDDCPAPANVRLVSLAGGTASFIWDSCNCSMPEYHVYYVKNCPAPRNPVPKISRESTIT